MSVPKHPTAPEHEDTSRIRRRWNGARIPAERSALEVPGPALSETVDANLEGLPESKLPDIAPTESLNVEPSEPVTEPGKRRKRS